jgi:hypothetical protein
MTGETGLATYPLVCSVTIWGFPLRNAMSRTAESDVCCEMDSGELFAS